MHVSPVKWCSHGSVSLKKFLVPIGTTATSENQVPGTGTDTVEMCGHCA